MISVLLLTYNEEMNLPRCLAALSWCDDVVVVDSFSTDRTVDIARAHGVRVLQRQFTDFADQRNFGLENGALRHPWVLHLDADEVVTDAFRTELFARLPATNAEVFRVASRMMFGDVWLEHAGMYPAYQVRLGLRDRLRFRQVGHGQREDETRYVTETLREPLIHYCFSKGIADWIDRHNRYSSDEARYALSRSGPRPDELSAASRDPVYRRRALKLLFASLPCRPTLRFLYMYVWRRGFLDGAAGYRYCRMLAMYEHMIVLKTEEQRGAHAH